MTANQENRLSMILAVLVCMDNNTALWQNTFAIMQTVDELKQTEQAIRGMHITQSKKTTGTTRNKKQQRTALANALISLTGPLAAYARQKQNNELLADVYMSLSAIKQLRDSNLKDYATSIYNFTQTYLTTLQADYGVTPNDVSNLATQQTLFDGLIASPRTRKTITKNATTRLVDLLENARNTLETLDDLIAPYINKNIDFYTTYHNARSIIDLHGKVTHRSKPDEDSADTQAQ